MITTIYRNLIPPTLREKVYRLILQDVLFFFRNFPTIFKSKFIYLCSFFLKMNEKNQAYSFMGKNGLTSYPFKTTKNYYKIDVCVYFGDEKLYYVLHNDKKLFFPKHLSEKEVRDLYISLILEQDELSPHRYIKDLSVMAGRTLFDIGSAEGIFSLETIELTEEVFLFECEDYWIEALNATFAPWKEKVHIIKRYVSDMNNEKCITLDTFCKNKNLSSIFFKMDIEGAEQSALQGAKHLLQTSSDLIASVCTYHKEKDVEEIGRFFNELGYKTEITDGYLYWDKELRRGVLRAKK